MKLSVSNIAWEVSDDSEVLEFLVSKGVAGLEIAPTKLWGDWSNVTASAACEYRERLRGMGLEVSALQSILFGRPSLRLFNPDSHREFFEHLAMLSELANQLGAGTLVFGAPKNRVRDRLPEEDANAMAAEFFWQAGEICRDADCVIGIENNPPQYGCDFLTTVREVDQFVKLVGHDNVRLHLDSGAVVMSGEDLAAEIATVASICHYHISEPMLRPILGGVVGHGAAFESLRSRRYENWVSIEMRLPERRVDLYGSIEKVTGMLQIDKGHLT